MLARAEGSTRLVLLATLLVVVSGGIYLYRSRLGFEAREVLDASARPASSAAPNAEVAGPSIRHPLPGTGASGVDSLPPLDQSDTAVWRTLADLFGEGELARFFVRDALIERFVATVDNLPQGKLPLDLRPIAPLDGRLYVTLQEGKAPSYRLSEQNFERYTPLLAALQFVSTERLVRAYADYYPLLQEAYERLGFPDGYFNDRVIEVIDHLLETPEIRGPIELVRPSVYYEFADPALEERSVGQKVLIRIGPKNAAVVKAKLREARARLVESAASEDALARRP